MLSDKYIKISGWADGYIITFKLGINNHEQSIWYSHSQVEPWCHTELVSFKPHSPNIPPHHLIRHVDDLKSIRLAPTNEYLLRVNIEKINQPPTHVLQEIWYFWEDSIIIFIQAPIKIYSYFSEPIFGSVGKRKEKMLVLSGDHWYCPNPATWQNQINWWQIS